MSPFRLSAGTFILELPYCSPAFLSFSFLYVEALFLTSNSRLLSELPASFLFLSSFIRSALARFLIYSPRDLKRNAFRQAERVNLLFVITH